MLAYAFMQRALVAGVILGLAVPLVGTLVVMRRLSMIGDALSHASLAGVAAGLIGGINPVLGASIAAIVAAGCVEVIRRRFESRAELAIAIVMATGVGLAGVLSGFVPNSATFSSFLFGSIVTVSDAELWGVVAVGGAVAILCWVLRRPLLLVTLDERGARFYGVRTDALNSLFVLFSALVISIASRTVGALIVSAMMVVPVACALVVARSWRQLVAVSCGVGVLSSLVGLTASFYLGVKPGGAIVLVSVAMLALLGAGKGALRRMGAPRDTTS